MGTTGLPAEFKRKVSDLIEAGRSVTDVARDLGISGQAISTWRRQDRIDRGLLPGLNSAEKGRIAQLEMELRATRRAIELVREVVPQSLYPAVKVMAAEGIPTELACRVVDVLVADRRPVLDDVYERHGVASAEFAAVLEPLHDLGRAVVEARSGSDVGEPVGST